MSSMTTSVPPSRPSSLGSWPTARLEAAIKDLGWTPEPHQLAPDPPWDAWLLVAGRGAGKTDADAHYVDTHASGPACIPGPVPHRIGIIAPTHEDAKRTCVVGESGLLSHNPDIRFTPGGKVADLIWPSGAVGNLFGAFTPEDVERLKRLQAEIHDGFKDWVRQRRASRLKGDEAALFNGEFWTGKRSLELGLVDGLGELRATLQARYGTKVRLPVIGPRRRLLSRLGLSAGLAEAGPATLAAIEERLHWQRFGL